MISLQLLMPREKEVGYGYVEPSVLLQRSSTSIKRFLRCQSWEFRKNEGTYEFDSIDIFTQLKSTSSHPRANKAARTGRAMHLESVQGGGSGLTIMGPYFRREL